MPLVALLPALIGAGGGIASSLINKHGSNKSPLLPAGLDHNALLSSINTQKGLADTFKTQGADFLGQGHDVLNQPLHYLQSILGGDRTSIMEALAPEIAAINAQFKAPLAQAGITGRGTSLQPDLEAGKQSAISDLFFKERPQAADKLTGIAQGLMNLGLGSQQAGAGVAGDVSKEILDYNSIIRGIQAQQSSQSAGVMGGLGASLGPVLATVLGGLNKGKSSSLPTVMQSDPNATRPRTTGTPDYTIYDSPIPHIYSSWLGDNNG